MSLLMRMLVISPPDRPSILRRAMDTFLLVLAPVISAFAFGSVAHAEMPLVKRTIDGFIRPAYADFRTETVALRHDIDLLCRERNDASFASARQAFRKTVVAWSTVETIRFGPVTRENRLERILFWPDRKSIGLKQVQAALAEKDGTATDPVLLAGKSVAMQGLGALEFVLFGTGSETLAMAGDPYRCQYGLAISANLETIAAGIAAEWDDPAGIAHQLANPGPDNLLYRTNSEAVTELFNVMVHGLELVRDVRTNGFLGEAAEGDKPKQAVHWRSEMTVRSIVANLVGIRRLFDAADFAPYLSADMAWIPGSIEFEFRNAENALMPLTGPVADLLADPTERGKLAYAGLVTSSLSELFGVRLAGALGLSAGFSSLDGD